jgi:hypothetical protein
MSREAESEAKATYKLIECVAVKEQDLDIEDIGFVDN